MVSLVKLSFNNMDDFQKLCEKNFEKETYDKDFFEYYENQSFFPKIFSKRFVKLLIYKEKFIGYMWYEVPVDNYVRIFSLYIDDMYINKINDDTLKKFNEKHLIYEAVEDLNRSALLENFGFKKIKPSLLMKLLLKNYNKAKVIEGIKHTIIDDNKILSLINNISNQKYDSLAIGFDKVDIKYEILLRCEIQNDIFESDNRVPIDIDDIENDIKQEYYIDDLAIFIKINDIVIGYGQIIYLRKRYTIVNFGIVRRFRGMGFGKILLDYLIKKAIDRGIDELALRVEDQNINAISLYKWIGFEYKYNIIRWER